MRQEVTDLESKHKLDLRSAEERYALEKHQLEGNLQEALNQMQNLIQKQQLIAPNGNTLTIDKENNGKSASHQTIDN